MNCSKFIRELMGKGVTQSMIGHHVGISQAAVSQLLKADGKRELTHSKGEKLAALHKRICAGGVPAGPAASTSAGAMA